jgi:nucleoside-diphosphate-sugar epimerase
VAGGLADRVPFELAWGRPFLLYGPGEDERRLIPYVARALLEGRPADVGDGALVRDFLHVEDVVGAFAALLDSDVRGPVNIASGVGVTLREAIELVAQAAGAPELVRFDRVPARPGDPRELVGSAELLREGTQFVPRIALEPGIAATVDWWRARLREG